MIRKYTFTVCLHILNSGIAVTWYAAELGVNYQQVTIGGQAQIFGLNIGQEFRTNGLQVLGHALFYGKWDFIIDNLLKNTFIDKISL